MQGLVWSCMSSCCMSTSLPCKTFQYNRVSILTCSGKKELRIFETNFYSRQCHVGSSSRWAGGSLARIIRGLWMVFVCHSVRLRQSDFFIEIWIWQQFRILLGSLSSHNSFFCTVYFTMSSLYLYSPAEYGWLWVSASAHPCFWKLFRFLKFQTVVTRNEGEWEGEKAYSIGGGGGGHQERKRVIGGGFMQSVQNSALSAAAAMSCNISSFDFMQYLLRY